MVGWLQRIFRRDGEEHSSPSSKRALASADASNATPWMDLSTLMRIESLELRVQRLVQGVQRGIHRSLRRGHSAEFAEYRAYSPGDDLRHLDWRRLARTDRPFVRQYEDESDWGTLFLVDMSASMSFGSAGYTKADYARTLAGTLGAFLHGQGDPIGLLRFAEELEEVVPLRRSAKQLARWWPVLAASPSGEGTGLATALDGALRLLRRPGMVVVVSDLLSPIEPWLAALRNLRAAGNEVLVFEVLDPHELEFPFEGDTRFENLEAPKRLDLDASQVRADYLAKLRVHREAVAEGCAREAAPLFRTRADAQLEPLLCAAITQISKQKSKARTRGAGNR